MFYNAIIIYYYRIAHTYYKILGCKSDENIYK